MYLALNILSTDDVDILVTQKMDGGHGTAQLLDGSKIGGICMIFRTPEDAYETLGTEISLIPLENITEPQSSEEPPSD